MNTIACDIQKLCIHFYNFLKKNLFVLFSEIRKNESRFFRFVEYTIFISGGFPEKNKNMFFRKIQKMNVMYSSNMILIHLNQYHRF